jgi:hypothetical protein
MWYLMAKFTKQRSGDTVSDAYAERYKEVMGDVQPHRLVHLEGGPCVDTAPARDRFIDLPAYVTCEVCKMTAALLGAEEDPDDIYEEGEKIKQALCTEPDPYAKALWEGRPCSRCNGAGRVTQALSAARPYLKSEVVCQVCGGEG